MSRIEWPDSGKLASWLDNAIEGTRPGSKIQNRLRGDIRQIVVSDHERKMLMNITWRSQPRAPLSPRTLADKKRGPGPSLIPRFRMSRYITTFMAEWLVQGGRSVLTMSFRGFVSKRGFPIPMAHENGVPRHNLPARPVMGIALAGMKEINDRFEQFATEVARGH